MLLSAEAIASLCGRSPGLEAWVLPESAEGQPGATELLHFGGSNSETSGPG
jgi:hypothetical protein